MVQKNIVGTYRTFLGLSALLMLCGFFFIYSASSVYALEVFGNAHYFVKKQAWGFAFGLVCLIIARLFPLTWLRSLTPLGLLGTWALTALTLVPAISWKIHGSRRWLALGGFGFQPSELIKIFFVLYLAHFFAQRSLKARACWRSYVAPVCALAITSVILLKQPDFGMLVTLCITGCFMMFVAHVPLAYLLTALGLFIPASIVLIIIQPYRLQRVFTFLNPWQDPQGKGFQIIQSLIAIGAGHWTGLGLAQSKQKYFYLPMQHTDFIFSIIAEEIGFIGCCILITLFIWWSYTGIKLALALKNNFSSLATLGFVVLLSLQTCINLAVATGLAPTKGIGMPFISYGNTGLVCTMIMIGIIMNMVHHEQ